MTMDLSTSCDIHCVQCFREILTPKPIKTGLEQIRVLEREVFPFLKWLSLSCTGEPLYLKNFPEALSAAKRAGVPFIRIQSNGTHLDEERSRMLIEGGLNYLGISLDASTRETFEKIRAGASWDSVIGNIKDFVRIRKANPTGLPQLGFNFTLMKQNADEAVDFIGLAKELGADVLSFSHFFIESWEMRDWSLIYDPPRANALYARLRSEAARVGIRTLVPEDLPERIQPFVHRDLENPCYRGKCASALESWMFLMPDGDCFPCLNLQDRGPIGNVFETPFSEIWYGARNQRFRKQALKGIVEGCDQCKFFAFTADLSNEGTYLAKRLTTRSAAEMDYHDHSEKIPNRSPSQSQALKTVGLTE